MSPQTKRAARLAPDAAREDATSKLKSTPIDSARQRLPLRLSKLKSLTGALSKRYELCGDGLRKVPAPQLYDGWCCSVEIRSLPELAACLDQTPNNQAFALCNIERDKTKVVTEDKADPLNDIIARTKAHFPWDTDAQAFMLFDGDVPGYTPDEFVTIIRGLDPAFVRAAAVGRYSTSSFIMGPYGINTGPKGIHVYVPVLHPELMDCAGKILAQRLWLAGFGFIALSKCGKLLVRQLIDALVWSPERTIYEASPMLGEGLVQQRPPSKIFKGQSVDLSHVTPLTDDEEAEYQRLVAKAKAEKMPEAELAFDQYLENAAFEQATTSEHLRKSWSGLKPNLHGNADAELGPNFMLDLGKHGRMTVLELVAKLDADQHVDGHFPDPIEGVAYNSTCAYVQPKKTRDGHWRIYSHAHGGIAYALRRELTTPDAEISALVALVREKLAELDKNAGALFDSQQACEALRQIRKSDRGEWARVRKEIMAKRAFKAEEFDGWLAGTDDAESGGTDSGDDDDTRPDLVSELVELVENRARLAYEDELTGVVIAEGGCQRVYHVPSLGFDIWLRGIHYARAKRGISDTTVKTAGQTVLAACIASGVRVQTHIRVARGPDDAYYIDLCDETGRAVRVTAGTWDVISDPPVLFLRPRDALPLPVPQRLKDWQTELRTHFLSHLNLATTQVIQARHGRQVSVSSRDPLLVLTFVMNTFRPDTPFPVLEIDGEQGSAKTNTQRRIRAVIDPHKVPLRGRPKTVEDIYVAARNNHVVSYENVSSLTAEHQDALCVLSTGGGHAGRALYTNGEEFSIQAKRPVIINGIGAAATRPDLIDRIIHIELPVIEDVNRKTEQELDAAWDASYALAFSAIVQCFAETLAQLPNVKLPERPRMADYAELGSALTLVLGGQPSVFLRAFEMNRAEGRDRVMDTFPVGGAVIDLLARQPAGFDGTVKDLFKLLQYNLGGRENIPTSPRGMAGQLKRVAPALKARGIVVTRVGHTNAGNRITIRPVVQSSPPVKAAAAAPAVKK